MKKLLVMTVLLLLVASGETSAFQLAAELVYVTSIASPYAPGQLAGVGGRVTLLDLGVASVGLSLDLLGTSNDLGYLPRLCLRNMPEGPAARAVFGLADALMFVNTTWPLMDGMRLVALAGVGDISYVAAKEGEEFSYNVYRGLRVKGEVRKRIALTADLFASAEFSPHLTHVYGTQPASASWWGAEVGVQANIPLGFARAGLRMNSLRESNADQRFAGVFVSGGFGF